MLYLLRFQLLQPLNNQTEIALLISDFNKETDQAISSLPAWYFCDNEIDANDCAQLVLQKVKTATTSSLYWFEHNGEALPQVGDLNIFTNWQGKPLGIIETTDVTITPYNEITAAYAALEGEGDKSLAYWNKVHWAYYQRELADTPFQCNKTMPLVCERFKLIFTAAHQLQTRATNDK